MSHQAMEMFALDERLLLSRMKFFIRYAETEIEMGHHRGWESVGAAGTSLVHAAQTAWFIDKRFFMDLLRRASDAYISLGLPYGHFLLSLVAPDDELANALNSPLASSLLEMISSGDMPSTKLGGLGPLAHRVVDFPNQRVYLLAAYLGHRHIARERSELIEAALERIEPHGSQPIGPQSAPIADYLRIERLVLELHRTYGDLSMERIISEMEPVMELGQRFSTAIDHGMRNRYLWTSLHSPVELVDFEAAGLCLRIAESAGDEHLVLIQKQVQRRLQPRAMMPFMVSQSLVRHHRSDDRGIL